MQSVTVATETQRRIRQRELAAADEKEAQEREEARKNKGFTQVYSRDGGASGSCQRAMRGPLACMPSSLNTSTLPVALLSAISSS